MKRMLCVFALQFLFSVLVYPQDTILIDGRPCPMVGTATQPSFQELDMLKNRYNFPTPADFDNSVTLEKILRPGPDEGRFNEQKAAEVTGYVVDAKIGGVEQCNCGTTSKAFRDTHIEIALDDQHTAETQRVIVEVTPRLRAIMEQKGIDWSTDNLSSTLKGHLVKFQGWLTFDFMHKGEAENTKPGRAKNWRATCWELHPVTDIQIMDGEGIASDFSGGASPITSLTQFATPTNIQPKNPMNSPVDLLATILLGAILGMAGQGARVIVGLKKTNDSALKANASFKESFEVGRLVLSLLYAGAIGTIAGVLVALQFIGSGDSTPLSTKLMFFASAGYAGTDFIEGFVNKQLKK